VDLPLFGKSDKPSSLSGSRMKYFADFLRGFLDALGIGRVNLVGNSIGGASCAKFAIENGDRLDRLVIMGGGGTVRFDPAKPESLGDGIVALVGFLGDPTRAAAEKMLSTFVYDYDKLPLDVVETRAELALQPEIVAAQRLLFGDPSGIEDLTDSLSEIEAKTLILWGREDRFIPLSGGMTYLQGIPDCEMHVFSHCGHWVMIEREAEFNRMVREFLGSSPRIVHGV
jgi:2-hydroxy-6-oxonona-2,4-dienedioate hydrolase